MCCHRCPGRSKHGVQQPACPSLLEAHLAAISGACAPPCPRTASASWGSLELERYSWHSSWRLIFCAASLPQSRSRSGRPAGRCVEGEARARQAG